MLFIFEYCNKQFYKLLNIVTKLLEAGVIKLEKIIFLIRQGD
jgi:hypothetical protein